MLLPIKFELLAGGVYVVSLIQVSLKVRHYSTFKGKLSLTIKALDNFLSHRRNLLLDLLDLAPTLLAFQLSASADFPQPLNL